MNSLSAPAVTVRKPLEDLVQCVKCKCSWFEQFSVRQYPALHNTVLGQFVPQAKDFTFVLLRCIRCQELHQPNVITSYADTQQKAYNDFLDMMESKDWQKEPSTTPEVKENEKAG